MSVRTSKISNLGRPGTARCQVLTDLAIDLVFGEPPLLLRGTRWAEFGSNRFAARAGNPHPGGVQ